MTVDETIKTEIKATTGWLILSREARRNALNAQMLQGIISSLKEFDNNASLTSIVITGAGEKAFCAGMDVSGKDVAALSFLERHELQRELVMLFKTIKNLGKPVVGRVQGIALGGGFGLMCACDLVIMAEDAQCGTPEINLGLFPYIIMATLIRVVNNPKLLLEMMFTGERISATTAKEMGFVNKVVKRAALDDVVNDITAKLSTKSPAILRLGRRAFYTMRDLEYDQALEYLSGMLALNMQAEDMTEGVAAFFEKRKPRWQGK